MLAPGHRTVALAVWTVCAPSCWTVAEWTAGALVAVHLSAGRWSPDVDQYVRPRPSDGRRSRSVRSALLRGMGGHRGVTHRVELVAMASAVAVAVAGQFGESWAGWAIACAWGTHVLADLPFGRVPCLNRRVGWSLPCGGPVADTVTAFALVIAVFGIVSRFFW